MVVGGTPCVLSMGVEQITPKPAGYAHTHFLPDFQQGGSLDLLFRVTQAVVKVLLGRGRAQFLVVRSLSAPRGHLITCHSALPHTLKPEDGTPAEPPPQASCSEAHRKRSGAPR